MCNSSGQYLEMILNLAYMHSSMNIYECFGATKPLTQMDWVIKSFKTCIFIQIITKTHEKKILRFLRVFVKKTCYLKSSRMYEMLAIQPEKKQSRMHPSHSLVDVHILFCGIGLFLVDISLVVFYHNLRAQIHPHPHFCNALLAILLPLQLIYL